MHIRTIRNHFEAIRHWEYLLDNKVLRTEKSRESQRRETPEINEISYIFDCALEHYMRSALGVYGASYGVNVESKKEFKLLTSSKAGLEDGPIYKNIGFLTDPETCLRWPFNNCRDTACFIDYMFTEHRGQQSLERNLPEFIAHLENDPLFAGQIQDSHYKPETVDIHFNPQNPVKERVLLCTSAEVMFFTTVWSFLTRYYAEAKKEDRAKELDAAKVSWSKLELVAAEAPEWWQDITWDENTVERVFADLFKKLEDQDQGGKKEHEKQVKEGWGRIRKSCLGHPHWIPLMEARCCEVSVDQHSSPEAEMPIEYSSDENQSKEALNFILDHVHQLTLHSAISLVSYSIKVAGSIIRNEVYPGSATPKDQLASSFDLSGDQKGACGVLIRKSLAVLDKALTRLSGVPAEPSALKSYLGIIRKDRNVKKSAAEILLGMPEEEGGMSPIDAITAIGYCFLYCQRPDLKDPDEPMDDWKDRSIPGLLKRLHKVARFPVIPYYVMSAIDGLPKQQLVFTVWNSPRYRNIFKLEEYVDVRSTQRSSPAAVNCLVTLLPFSVHTYFHLKSQQGGRLKSRTNKELVNLESDGLTSLKAITNHIITVDVISACKAFFDRISQPIVDIWFYANSVVAEESSQARNLGSKVILHHLPNDLAPAFKELIAYQEQFKDQGFRIPPALYVVGMEAMLHTRDFDDIKRQVFRLPHLDDILKEQGVGKEFIQELTKPDGVAMVLATSRLETERVADGKKVTVSVMVDEDASQSLETLKPDDNDSELEHWVFTGAIIILLKEAIQHTVLCQLSDCGAGTDQSRFKVSVTIDSVNKMIRISNPCTADALGKYRERSRQAIDIANLQKFMKRWTIDEPFVDGKPEEYCWVRTIRFEA